MKAKRLAALHAALFTAVMLTFGLLLFPMTGHSEVKETNLIEKANLITTEDFIEYASINDVNIHELYFGTILYEGTESCLMCHEDQGANVLDTGHFKWEGKTKNIVGLEGGLHGKNDLLNNFCIAVLPARCGSFPLTRTCDGFYDGSP